MAWAEEGKQALFFHNGSAGECCIDRYWYQVYPGEWWAMSHAEPYLLRVLRQAGKARDFVEEMLKGRRSSSRAWWTATRTRSSSAPPGCSG